MQDLLLILSRTSKPRWKVDSQVKGAGSFMQIDFTGWIMALFSWRYGPTRTIHIEKNMSFVLFLFPLRFFLFLASLCSLSQSNQLSVSMHSRPLLLCIFSFCMRILYHLFWYINQRTGHVSSRLVLYQTDHLLIMMNEACWYSHWTAARLMCCLCQSSYLGWVYLTILFWVERQMISIQHRSSYQWPNCWIH